VTTTVAAGPPVAAFGDLEQNIWGVAFGGAHPCLAVGSLADAEAVPLEAATLADGSGDWALTGANHSVALAPAAAAGAPIASSAEDSVLSPAVRLELCRVEGEAPLGGVRCAALPTGRLDSIRLVAAWFPDDRAVAVLAARPHGVNGQDRDAIAVQVLGEPEGMSVFDPRLSTTYGSNGDPRRMGIELRVGETEDGDQYPRRIAGETTGATAHDGAGGWRWQAFALRCHGRGADGAGVYLLIRPA
jgi:hypothetical protein